MLNLLQGKMIILTGSQTVASINALVEQHGGIVKHFPLIETVENVTADDEQWLNKLQHYTWLIFTSQTAVASFAAKCKRHNLNLDSIPCKIAAVGDKTAEALKAAKLNVHFIPTTFSADVFVKEFVLNENERALFLKGSMAKSTIRDRTGADEWTVYETKECTRYVNELEQCILVSPEPIVIFASPSAVKVYAQHIAPKTDWRFVKIASIGHVTTSALAQFGVTPSVQPEIYTMKAVIEQLIMEEQSS